jgi:hypothetical protein
MTVVIRKLLVTSGAGERSAKATSPTRYLRFPIAPSLLWSACAVLASECSTKTSARRPPRYAGDGSHALAVSTLREWLGQDRHESVRVVVQQDNRRLHVMPALRACQLFSLDANCRGAIPMRGLFLLDDKVEEQRYIMFPFWPSVRSGAPARI